MQNLKELAHHSSYNTLGGMYEPRYLWVGPVCLANMRRRNHPILAHFVLVIMLISRERCFLSRKLVMYFTVMILLLTIIPVGCGGTSPKNDAVTEKPKLVTNENQNLAESKTPEKVVRTEFTALEKQIYDYMESIWEGYESNYGIDEAEAQVFIDTSKEFKKPIIEVYRTYSLIQNVESGIKLTDAEIDTLGMRRLKDIGFNERNGKWYYDGVVVNMGKPLPPPDSMSPQKTEKGLEISLKVDAIVSELKKIQVKGETNLPDETELMISLENTGINYSAQDEAIVQNGSFTSNWFSDSSRPAGRMANGTYILEITTPTVSVLSPSVKAILGENGKNMTGKFIKFDQVFGNQIEYSKTITVD